MSSFQKSFFSRSDPVEFHLNVIKTWKPQSEVWPFVYGSDAVSLTSAFSGFNMCYFLRKELKIRPFAKVTCYAPVLGLAVVGSMVLQNYIDNRILSHDLCPSCVAMKGAAGQITVGTIYPLILSHMVTFYMADRIVTYPVPPLLRAPKEFFQLFVRLTLKNKKAILSTAALQVVASIFVTSQKQSAFLNLIK